MSFQHSGLEGRSSAKRGFFLNREDKLHGAVLDGLALHHSQCGGHAHTVVRTQRGAVRVEPVFFANHADAVGIKVEVRAFVLFANHVQMALQGGHRRGFTAGVGRLANHCISEIIDNRFQPKAGGKLQHMIARRCFLGGIAGNRSQRFKVFPNLLGFNSS